MNADHTELTTLDDAALLTKVREQHGDADAAFEALYHRHHGAALGMARRLGGPDLAPELVAEAFVRILSLLRRGAGPRTTFRAYLSATVNSVWVDHLRSNVRHVWVDDEERLEPLLSVDDGATARAEAGVIGAAFASLPQRWQSVLWLASVDDVSYDEIGRLFGLSPNAVAALVKRAREGLRQAYLTEHLGVREDPECLEVAPLLAAYVRGRASGRSVRRVETHLEGCDACREAVRELEGMSVRLGAWLLPAVALLVAGSERVGGLLAGDAALVSALGSGAPGAVGAVGAMGVAGLAGASGGASGASAAAGAAGSASGAGMSGGLVAVSLIAVLGVAGFVGERALDGRQVDQEVATPSTTATAPAPANPPVVPPPPVAPPVPVPPEAPATSDPRATPAPRPTQAPAPPPAPAPTPTPTVPVDPVDPVDPRIDAEAITVTPDPDYPGWSLVTIPMEDVVDGTAIEMAGEGCVDAMVVHPDLQTLLMIDLPWATVLESSGDVLRLDVMHHPGAEFTVSLLDAEGGDPSNDSAVVTLD